MTRVNLVKISLTLPWNEMFQERNTWFWHQDRLPVFRSQLKTRGLHRNIHVAEGSRPTNLKESMSTFRDKKGKREKISRWKESATMRIRENSPRKDPTQSLSFSLRWSSSGHFGKVSLPRFSPVPDSPQWSWRMTADRLQLHMETKSRKPTNEPTSRSATHLYSCYAAPSGWAHF